MSASNVGGLSGIVFDAYGTLFDVSALDHACAALTTDPAALTRLWRSKQLEYSFLRTTIDRYADFGQITSDALDYAATALRVELDPVERGTLMRAWTTLPPFPDVAPALERLTMSGNRMVILSNGTRQMLHPLLAGSGLAGMFIAVLSSEDVQTFKPDAAIYALGPELFHSRTWELMFVTANGFDVAGAKAFGYSVCRVDRYGLPNDALGFDPDVTVKDLGELAELLCGQ